jgi:hypothetical protein
MPLTLQTMNGTFSVAGCSMNPWLRRTADAVFGITVRKALSSYAHLNLDARREYLDNLDKLKIGAFSKFQATTP